MTREELVNCARWEGMAPGNEAAEDATTLALMLLAIHAELDKVANDERAKKLKKTVANIRNILGRTA